MWRDKSNFTGRDVWRDDKGIKQSSGRWQNRGNASLCKSHWYPSYDPSLTKNNIIIFHSIWYMRKYINWSSSQQQKGAEIRECEEGKFGRAGHTAANHAPTETAGSLNSLKPSHLIGHQVEYFKPQDKTFKCFLQFDKKINDERQGYSHLLFRLVFWSSGSLSPTLLSENRRCRVGEFLTDGQ